jgi:hypothetical protein
LNTGDNRAGKREVITDHNTFFVISQTTRVLGDEGEFFETDIIH